MKRSINVRGFTIVEVMIAMALAVAVIGTAMAFIVELARGNLITGQRVSQSMEMRRFSQDMIYTASRANQFFLYRSSAAADRATPANQMAFGTNGTDVLCPAGDFIAFVFYEYPKQPGFTYHRIQKVICYYLDTAAGQIGAIQKVTIDLSKNILTNAPTLGTQVEDYDDTNSTTVVEQVIANFWGDTTHRSSVTYAVNARGLFQSETSNEGFGRLFYYRDARVSLMVAGQLFGRNNTSDKLTYTDTFCLSVTPRS